MNLSTSSHSITQSANLQNDLQVSPKIIQLEETSNYGHPDSIPNENNREHIKNSNYSNVSFKEIQEKYQTKYMDFPKTLLGKSSRFNIYLNILLFLTHVCQQK